MVIAKAAGLDQKHATALINNFIEKFETWCNQHRPPSNAEVEKYVSKDFRNSSNGEVTGKNVADFIKRITSLQQKHSHTEVSTVRDCLVSGNRAVVQFDVKLKERSGESKELFVMAIVTFEDNLITNWVQVAHCKNPAHK